MEIFYLPKFVRQYKKLAAAVKDDAENAENIFRVNPFDKQIETHKLHGPLRGLYAFSVNRKYRIIFDFDADANVRFYAIGNHDIYE